MASLPSLESIVQGAVTTIAALPGIGTVASQEGGASTWSTEPQPGQSYWIVGHQSSEGSEVTAGGSGPSGGTYGAKRLRRITVDGWMPWGFAGSSAVEWRQRVQQVLDQIDTHRQLSVCARMVAMPDVEFNRLEFYQSLHQGDLSTLCHHARIFFTVVAHRTVTLD